MSNRALNLAWAVELPGLEKMVLVALADLADDRKNDTCWPSIAHLVKMSGFSERAVQKAVRSLETAGHISRLEKPGRGVIYTIHPRTTCTPAQDAPAHGEAFTPAPRAPNPSRTIKPPEPSGSAPKGAAPAQEHFRDKREKKRGTRLPTDWHPGNLPDDLSAKVQALPPGWLADQAVRFRDHFHAAAGPKAFQADWDARWRTWVRNSLDRLPAEGGDASGPKRAAESSFEIERKGDGLDEFRARMASQIGIRSWKAWFGPASIESRNGSIIVKADTRFTKDRIQTEFEMPLRHVAKSCGFADEVLIEVAA